MGERNIVSGKLKVPFRKQFEYYRYHVLTDKSGIFRPVLPITVGPFDMTLDELRGKPDDVLIEIIQLFPGRNARDENIKYAAMVVSGDRRGLEIVDGRLYIPRHYSGDFDFRTAYENMPIIEVAERISRAARKIRDFDTYAREYVLR